MPRLSTGPKTYYKIIVKPECKKLHPYAPDGPFPAFICSTKGFFMDDLGHTYKYNEITMTEGFPK